MYFLIGLGIILAIIGINEWYIYTKKKKDNTAENRTAAEAVSAAGAERLTDSGTADIVKEAEQSVNRDFFYLNLADIIAGKIKQKQNIFGLPLILCETDGKGKLTALDREDNIYVIETALRPEYDDWYQQVFADMAEEKRRIQKKANERSVYAIVCTNEPSELLKAAVEKEPGIRIYRVDLSFVNVL